MPAMRWCSFSKRPFLYSVAYHKVTRYIFKRFSRALLKKGRRMQCRNSVGSDIHINTFQDCEQWNLYRGVKNVNKHSTAGKRMRDYLPLHYSILCVTCIQFINRFSSIRRHSYTNARYCDLISTISYSLLLTNYFAIKSADGEWEFVGREFRHLFGFGVALCDERAFAIGVLYSYTWNFFENYHLVGLVG